MTDIFDETDDIALELDEIPVFDSGTAGIASASQLVDGTNEIVIDESYTT